MEEQDKTKTSGCGLLLAALFVLIGIFTLYMSVRDTYNAYKTVNWLKVEATLNKVKIEAEDDMYHVRVHYQYVVSGKQYQSYRLAFGYGFNNIDRHHEIYDRLKEAKKVTAYVHPSNHKEAVLLQGMNKSILLMIVFASFWNSMIILFGLLSFSKINPNRIIPIGMSIIILVWIGSIFLLGAQLPVENNIEVLEYVSLKKK